MKIFIILFIITLFLINTNQAQSVICLTKSKVEWQEDRKNLLKSFNGDPSTVEIVRMNIHFTLKTDGTGNFTETDDNQGNNLSGYQFAKDVVDKINQYQTSNDQMYLPPNNNTSNDPKNYFYVLEAVYFHRNDTYHTYGNISSANIKEHMDSVINVFFVGSPVNNDPAKNDELGGYASSVSHYSNIKYTEIGSAYTRYVGYLNRVASGQSDNYSWVIHATARTTEHEIGHLLGLDHTVRYNWGPLCPTNAPNSSNCDDGCADTPSAYEMINVYGSPQHPACGWASNPPWCSNNMMDYGRFSALTPCQINIIHNGLEGGMTSYTQCAAVYKDEDICNLDYPYLVHNGKNIKIGQCTSGAELSGKEDITLHFSESVDFGVFEVKDNAVFEVIQINTCN